MPSWKKLVVSGSDTHLNSLNVNTFVSASNFAGDGSGITGVISSSYAVTASYIDPTFISASAAASGFGTGGGGLTDTGSLLTTASAAGSTITFEKGDGTTFDLTVLSSISQIASVTEDFTSQTSVAVTHSLDTRNIHVSVYDTNFSLVVPESITLDTLDTVVVTFPTPQSGTVVVAQGGHIISGSVPWENISNIPTGILSGSAQIASDISGSFISVSSSIASDIEDIIDGTTTVTSASFALTASYALNAGGGTGVGFPFSGSAEITGSFLVSGSFVDFTNATVISGSIFSGSFVGNGSGLTDLGFGDTKKLNQTVAATTWSFSHNMNEQYPTVTVYNVSNEVVQPSKIEAQDAQTLKLYFGIPTAGTAVAVVGGTATTQEAGFNRVLSQTVAATTWSFVHNLGQKYPQFEVYDSNDEIIIPGKVEAVDQNNAIFYFDTPQAGTVAATVGGTAMTASYADTLTIIDTLLTTQQNTDVDTGIETVATVSTTFYDGAFFDYVLKDGTNYRAGTVSAVWDGTSVQFSETSTTDIGNTNSVTMSVDITGSDARLRATVGSDNWNIKAFVRAL